LTIRNARKQGDQIGRIFASWAILYFGQGFENDSWATFRAMFSKTHLVTLPAQNSSVSQQTIQPPPLPRFPEADDDP
jgi:hypothetical protein